VNELVEAADEKVLAKTIASYGCAAIVDRLTLTATIIETGADSYRLAHQAAN
jgi:hypothetical protein